MIMPRDGSHVSSVGRLVLVIALTANCGTAPPVPSSDPFQLHLTTGGRRGYSYRMAEALANTLSSRNANYSIDFETTEDVASVQSIQQGKTDCGFTSANIAYEAFAGRLPDDPRRYDRLRGVALVQLAPLHFLVRTGSPVRDVSDLRGKTVAIGSPGTATSRIALLVLRAYGLGRDSVHIRDEGILRALSPAVTGGSDGAFLLYGQTLPSEGRSRVTNVQVVPIYGPEIDRLRQEYQFIRPALILAGTYAGQREAIRTIGVESMLICRADLAAERVQEITDAWFRTTNHLLQGNFMFDAVSPELASATPIPLHEGAMRYYRGKRVTQ
jgi:TRAP transporter TAXI family solute receptor